MSGDARVALPLFRQECGGSIPTSPLQFEIIKIPIKRAKELNLLWHSRLPYFPLNFSKVSFGGLYEGKYYCCAIWSDPVARLFNNKGYLELRRMAICNDAPKNTASRFLAIMTKIIKKDFPEIVKLISYQDTYVHSGTIYKASGWVSAYYRDRGNEKGWENRAGCITQTKTDDGKNSPKIRWEKQIKQ